ncbi:hypothetical protein [Flavihumibacter solisilvae]|nr:hypothetical protein [Flavihumibacter solisilvae]
MKRLDLLFRTTPFNGGFIVLARTHGQNGAGNDLLRFPVLPGDKLCFQVLLKNPDLLNFAELPVQPLKGQAFYLANDVNDPAAPADNLHLTIQSTGISASDDLIKKAGSDYRFHHPAVVTPGTVLVKHIETGRTKTPFSIDVFAGETDLLFDLSASPAGKYQLLINNAVTDSFYLLNTNLIEPVFGIIEIFLSPSIGSNYRVVEADQSLLPARPAFRIVFVNRKTKWRYTFHILAEGPLHQEIMKMTPADRATFLGSLNIATNDTQVGFTKISANENDFLFESQQPLPMQEIYFSSSNPKQVLNLRLVKDFGSPNPKDLKGFLPYPTTAKINATNTASVYSDVFLTL